MAVISLHTRTQNFVSWIRPDSDKAEDVRLQRDDVKERIKNKAEEDGLVVRSMPHSGSFAKANGLRRHMLGDGEHEGQDVDCPFVLSRSDEDGDPLTVLLPRFERYAKACYPDTPLELTKSSVKLKFISSKLNFDLVPMLAVEKKDTEQVLLRAGGVRRRTSIQQHVEFVKNRTRLSQALKGPVAFNDAQRLVKWWREYQVSQGTIIDDVPSFLLELLCAKAFDESSVQAKYPETLVTWFDNIHSYAKQRREISFGDFGGGPAKFEAKWKVIDPVNAENNAVPGSWSNIHLDEFASWAAGARDTIQQAIAHEMRGREGDAVALMAQVFGSSFKNHSEA